MQNFVQKGEVVTVTTPAGGVVSGAGLLIGSLFGVAATTESEGDDVEIVTQGVFDLAKAAGAVTAGAALYWDVGAKKVTTTATANTLIGAATQAAADGDATSRVRLNGIFGAASSAALFPATSPETSIVPCAVASSRSSSPVHVAVGW